MMKKLLVPILLVAAAAVFVGCVPPEIKSSVYVSELTLRHTTADANAERPPLWNADPNATAEERLSRREEQLEYSLEVMKKVSRNLKTVREWMEAN